MAEGSLRDLTGPLAPNPHALLCARWGCTNGVGSFNEAIKQESRPAAWGGDVAVAVKTAGLGMVKRFTDFRERLNLDQNAQRIAAFLTRPDSGRVVAQL